jgi:hypothetical protein
MAGGTAAVGTGYAHIVGGKKPGSSKEIEQRAAEIAVMIDENPDLTPEQKATLFAQMEQVVGQVGEITAVQEREAPEEPFEGTLEAAAKAGDTQQPTQPVAEKVYMKGFAAKLTAIRNNADNMVAGAGNKVNQKKAMRKDLQQITGHYESIADEIEQNKADMPELDEIKQLLPAYKQTVEAFIKSPTEEGFGQIKEIGDKIGELGAVYGGGISTERAKEMTIEAPAEKEKAKLRAKEYAKKLKTELKNQQDREKAIKKIASKWEKKIGQNGLTRQEAQQKALEEIKATGYLSAEPEKAAEAKPVPQLTPEDKARDEEIGRLFELALEGDKDAAIKLEQLTAEQITSREEPLDLFAGEKKLADERQQLHLQQAKAHVIARRLGMDDKTRKELQKKLTGKESMKDMTPEQAKQVADYLSSVAKEEGIESSTGQELAEYLRRSLKPKQAAANAAQLLPGQKPLGVKGVWKKALGGVKAFLKDHTRALRVCEALDGYKDGPMMQSIFLPTMKAADGSRRTEARRSQDYIDAMKEIFTDKDGNYDKKAHDAFLKPTRQVAVKAMGKNGKAIEIELNPWERVGLFIYARQPGSQKRLTATFEDFARPEAAIAEALQKVTAYERAIADYLVTELESHWPRIQQAARIALGRELTKEEMYFMMRGIDETVEDLPDLFNEMLGRVGNETARVREISEVKERQKGVMKPLDLDAITTYLLSLSRMEQFIHMAPVVKTVGQEILSDLAFQQAVNERTDGFGARYLRDWFADSARGYVPETGRQIAQVINWMRRKGVTYFLAGNLPSIGRQTISACNAASVHPAVAARVISNLAACSKPGNYATMKERADSKSDMMANRSFDRDIKSRTTDLRKWQKSKKDFDQVALMGQRITDRYTTVASWNALYDSAMSDKSVQKYFELDGSEQTAIDFADLWVSKTQPMGNVEHLPGLFRGGALSKMLTAFRNMPNQSLLAIKHDIYGAWKAGKIGNAMAMYRMLTIWIAPAFLLGLSRRGRWWESWAEAGIDMTTVPLAGLVLLGDAITGALEGFAGTNVGVHMAGFAEAGKAWQSLTKGDIKGLAWRGGKTIGAVTGRIPIQTFRTAEGIKDIATGETKDWRRLIWSEWSLKSKKEKEELTGTGRGVPSRRGTGGRQGTPSRR